MVQRSEQLEAVFEITVLKRRTMPHVGLTYYTYVHVKKRKKRFNKVMELTDTQTQTHKLTHSPTKRPNN